jgi:hypothetical protein
VSLDRLPASIEKGVQRFAEELHISHDEAIVQLIQTGLAARRRSVDPKAAQGKKPGEFLIGLFSNQEDGVIFDEATAYSRELRQSERLRDVWR